MSAYSLGFNQIDSWKQSLIDSNWFPLEVCSEAEDNVWRTISCTILNS